MSEVALIPTCTNRDMLRDLMPLNTIATDPWNWDIHFEGLTSEDTFFDVALGPEDVALAQAEYLQEDFLGWNDEYNMGYARTSVVVPMPGPGGSWIWAVNSGRASTNLVSLSTSCPYFPASFRGSRRILPRTTTELFHGFLENNG